MPADPGALFGPRPGGNADEAFVEGPCQAILLRAGEAAGIDFWLGHLSAGVSRTAVAAGFSDSAENRADETQFYYREILGRRRRRRGRCRCPARRTAGRCRRR